jgi:excisionase family DNA binding protein
VNPLLLNIPEAAAMLAIKPSTLYRLVEQGKIAHRRVCGIKFTRQDLDDYIDSCRVEVRGVPEPRVVTGPLKWIRKERIS